MDQIAILIPLVAGISATVLKFAIHSLAPTAVIGFVRRSPRTYGFLRSPSASSRLVPEKCTAFLIGVAIVGSFPQDLDARPTGSNRPSNDVH